MQRNDKVKIDLYNGDSYELIKNIPSNSVDLIIIDPPYEIHAGIGGGIYNNGDKKYIKELIGIDKGFNFELLEELERVQKNIYIYIWCSQKQVSKLLEYYKNKNCNYTILTWHKTNPIPACHNKYLTDTEFCLLFRQKGCKIYGNYDSKKTFYVSPLNYEDKKKYKHPTIKPLKIIENLIINSSKER